jgi:hypothetical protein
MCGSTKEYLNVYVPHDRAKGRYVSLFRFNEARNVWQEYSDYLNGWQNDPTIPRDEIDGRALLKTEFLDSSYYKVVQYDKTWADAEFVTEKQIEDRIREISYAEEDYYYGAA